MMSVMIPLSPRNNPHAYRKALGRFATGITVITTMTPDGPVGITINSFSSVSLDPALILWSLGKTSNRHDTFQSAKHFAVHVLDADQRDVCDAFVQSTNGFDGVEISINPQGVPLITGCLAVFECEQYSCHNAGDHTIILGEVHRAQERGGTALVFANGGYATLALAGSV